MSQVSFDVPSMSQVSFQCDTTDHLNSLNLQLQGRASCIGDLSEKVYVYQRNLAIFQTDLTEKMLHFPTLSDVVTDETSMKAMQKFLNDLNENFKMRFENFKIRRDLLLFVRNPFLVSADGPCSSEAKNILVLQVLAHVHSNVGVCLPRALPPESFPLSGICHTDSGAPWSRMVIVLIERVLTTRHPLSSFLLPMRVAGTTVCPCVSHILLQWTWILLFCIVISICSRYISVVKTVRIANPAQRGKSLWAPGMPQSPEFVLCFMPQVSVTPILAD
nr:uncharacterized protein LOC103306479 [Chrysemys picta bellii]